MPTSAGILVKTIGNGSIFKKAASSLAADSLEVEPIMHIPAQPASGPGLAAKKSATWLRVGVKVIYLSTLWSKPTNSRSPQGRCRAGLRSIKCSPAAALFTPGGCPLAADARGVRRQRQNSAIDEQGRGVQEGCLLALAGFSAGASASSPRRASASAPSKTRSRSPISIPASTRAHRTLPAGLARRCSAISS